MQGILEPTNTSKGKTAPFVRAHEHLLFGAIPGQITYIDSSRAPEARAKKIWAFLVVIVKKNMNFTPRNGQGEFLNNRKPEFMRFWRIH